MRSRGTPEDTACAARRFASAGSSAQNIILQAIHGLQKHCCFAFFLGGSPAWLAYPVHNSIADELCKENHACAAAAALSVSLFVSGLQPCKYRLLKSHTQSLRGTTFCGDQTSCAYQHYNGLHVPQQKGSNQTSTSADQVVIEHRNNTSSLQLCNLRISSCITDLA